MTKTHDESDRHGDALRRWAVRKSALLVLRVYNRLPFNPFRVPGLRWVGKRARTAYRDNDPWEDYLNDTH